MTKYSKGAGMHARLFIPSHLGDQCLVHVGMASQLPLVWPEPNKVPGVVLGEAVAGRSTCAPGLPFGQIHFIEAFTRGHLIALKAFDARDYWLGWRRAGHHGRGVRESTAGQTGI